MTERYSGWDAIFMYDIRADGKADLLSVNLSPSSGDGPRNSHPTANGKLLYVVCPPQKKVTVVKANITNQINEHSQFIMK